MFKKVLSVALAATMIASIGAVVASAAETEKSDLAANDDSSVVSADDSSSAVGDGSTIYFDVASSGWNNYTKVYCHIWRADGKGNWASWQTKKEIMTKVDDKIYSYDVTKAGTNEDGNSIQKSDGKNYCIIFSADTGVQTYNMIMSGSCIGDTAYVTGNELENPVDSEKKATEAAWKNNKDCGAQKVISSTAKVVGSALADGTTDVTLFADYLVTYNAEDGKLDKSQDVVNALGLSTDDLKSVVSQVKYSFEKKVSKEEMKKDDADAAVEKLIKVVAGLKGKDGGQVSEEEAKKQEAVDTSKNNGSSNNNSNSSNSNSNSSNNNSNGSGSVKSGQDMTIYFVFGGVMIAAAGVMFLARKKD